MKKLFIITILAFLALQSNAQSKFEKYNPMENEVHKLIGRKLIPNRFSAITLYKSIKDNKEQLIYPKYISENLALNSDYDLIKNDTFLVIDTLTKKSKYILDDIYLKLINLQKSDTCYLEYKWINFNFLTEISKDNLFEKKDCDLLSREVDDFTNIVNIQTPQFESTGSHPIVLYKDIKKGVASYTIGLSVSSVNAHIFTGAKTIQILFEDNTKMTKISNINTKVGNDGNFNYFAFCNLNKKELIVFQNKIVKKIRLGFLDGELKYIDALELNFLSKCIESTK
jgi:hypothetical protein